MKTPNKLTSEIINFRNSIPAINKFTLKEIMNKPKFFDWVKCVANNQCKFYMYLGGGDDGVAMRFFWNGCYEPKTLDLWVKLVKQSQGVIDIGAHTGSYTLAAWMSNSQAKIFSFEPHYLNFSRLNLNLRGNGISTSNAFMFACGNTNQIAPFSVSTSLDYLSTGGSLGKRAHAAMNYVQVVSVDKFFRKTKGLVIDLIKLDVEGHEPQCLIGLGDIIERDKPTFILESVHLDSSKVSESFLKDRGYVFFMIDDNSGHVEEVERLEPTFNDSGSINMERLNRLAVHSSKIQLLNTILINLV